MQRNCYRNIPGEKSRSSLRILSALVLVTLLSGVLVADEHHIVFDEHTEFSKFRTFAIRNSKSDSVLPEINNPLYLKRIADTIRIALSARGLKETVDRPDLFVDLHIGGTELSTADRPSERLRGGVLFAQGTVTVDLIRRDPVLLVWKGIFHDDESNGSKLARKLPSDVKSLLAKYPPKE
jgi:hypothetical protein